jgi:hypothetical protein
MTVVEADHRYGSGHESGDLERIQSETGARRGMGVAQWPEVVYFLVSKQKPHALLGSSAQGVLDYSVQDRIAKSRSVSDRF